MGRKPKCTVEEKVSADKVSPVEQEKIAVLCHLCYTDTCLINSATLWRIINK